MGQSTRAAPGIYEVHLRGHLDERWSASFPGLEMAHEVDPQGRPLTVLHGPIVDEASLHGILARIRDLGIPLLLMERTGDGAPESDSVAPDAATDARSTGP